MADILMQMMSNFTSTITNSLQRHKSNHSSSTDTPEILNQFISVFWDLYKEVLFSQCPHECSDNMQQKWNESNEQYKLPDNFGDVFLQFLVAVRNIIQHLIRWLNIIIPTKTRDENTRYLFNVASHMVLCMDSLTCMYEDLIGFTPGKPYTQKKDLIGSICCVYRFLYYIARYLCFYIICIIKILLRSVFVIVKACVFPFKVIYRCVKLWLWLIWS